MPINKSETTYILNIADVVPEFSKLDSDTKDRLKPLIAEAVIFGINDYLDKSASPVSGGKFKSFKANKDPSQLFEKGDMRSAITWEDQSSNRIKIGIFDKDEAIKSYNHNVGDTVPVRKFIPSQDENFKVSILNAIKGIVKSEI